MATVKTQEHVDFRYRIGNTLSAHRTRQKINQTKLADRINCARKRVSMIENGGADITVWELKQYCEMCDIDAISIIYGKRGQVELNTDFYKLSDSDRECVNNVIQSLASKDTSE